MEWVTGSGAPLRDIHDGEVIRPAVGPAPDALRHWQPCPQNAAAAVAPTASSGSTLAWLTAKPNFKVLLFPASSSVLGSRARID